MTKAELLNNAKRIQAAAQELLDKTSVLKTDIGNSLQAAKRHESKLISKERAAEAEHMAAVVQGGACGDPFRGDRAAVG